MFGYFYGRKQAKKHLSSGKNFLLFNNYSVSKWVGNSGLWDEIKDVNTKIVEQEVWGGEVGFGGFVCFFHGNDLQRLQ